MKILHYTLGLPPYRTGGLTKYSTDLMIEQANDRENTIFLLFPGRFGFSKKTNIKFYDKFKDIIVYEIINPLPVPLLNGILNVDIYMERKDYLKEIFKEFFYKNSIDIIHIHTLMGLPIEFINAAKELNVKMVFTTHDYFGLCPKVNFIDYKGELCCGNLNNCGICNKTAFSLRKIKIMQSKFYRNFKQIKIIKYIRTKEKNKISNINLIRNENELYEMNKKYLNLRNFYIEMLSKVDYIHFNSNISKNIYSSFLNLRGEVISITHENIKDNRFIKDYDQNKLKILFLGPIDKYKGLPLLIESLKEIDKDKWELDIYGNCGTLESASGFENIRFNGRYNYQSLECILKNYDCLIVPSIWYETFGFIVLEALSYGMPVIATSLVGATDLLENEYNGFIVNPDINSMKKILEYVIYNKNILSNINENICKTKYIFEIKEHSELIYKMYKKVLGVR